MKRTSHATCHLCEATCGLEVEHDDHSVFAIRGDDADVFSRGYLCPKAYALKDVHEDPDRLRRPLVREAAGFREVSWDEALDRAAEGLARVRQKHGDDSIATYLGNPTTHSYAAILYALPLFKVLNTKNRFSSNSIDALPKLLTSYLMYGNQATLSVPDVDRTDFLLVIGANPVISNGSICCAPGMRKRLEALRARGARLVVVDPRRTETAQLADQHIFIKPGSDAWLLAAMLNLWFGEQLVTLGRLEPHCRGLAEVRQALRPFSVDRASIHTGIPEATIRQLARDFAAARSAACYSRLGACVQDFGATTTWLGELMNALSGNLDQPGGMMFSRAGVDLPALARSIGERGSFASFRSRIGGYPEFAGELPLAILAEEMETEGPGQVRAMITHAGNLALSAPNGARLGRALAKLDFMVAIDIYVNETTRHADVILPPTWGLEKGDFPLLFRSFAVRNTAKYSPALLKPEPGALEDWEIFLALTQRLAGKQRFGRLLAPALQAILAGGPKRLISAGLRFGPYGLSLKQLARRPHGIDLGPLTPRLPALLSGKLELAPEPMLRDLERLRARAKASDGLSLIGRRHQRSNNSWLHNTERLVKGPARCTLLVHPEDAKRASVKPGQEVWLESSVGKVRVPVEISDEVMPGVVSLPHGWGHDQEGVRLSVAKRHAGVSINDVTDDARVDAVSGTSSLNGVPVRLTGV